jgi:serine/threonine protein kinase
MVTEYCKEGDLQKYIKSKGKIPEPETAYLFKQIVEGVGHLHKELVLH